MEKVKNLPDDILLDVDDFIDFLQNKRKKGMYDWNWLSRKSDRVEDSDLSDYLDGLTKYENMLANNNRLLQNREFSNLNVMPTNAGISKVRYY